MGKSQDLNTKNTLAVIAIILAVVIGYFWMQDNKSDAPQSPFNQPSTQSPFGEGWTPEQQVPPQQQPQQPRIPPPPQDGGSGGGCPPRDDNCPR